MLMTSTIDTSIFNTLSIVPAATGIEPIFKNAREDFFKINEDYEKQIKIISSYFIINRFINGKLCLKMWSTEKILE